MFLFVLTFPWATLVRFFRRAIFLIPQLFIDNYDNLFELLVEEILTNYCGYCECRSFKFSNRSNRVFILEIKKVFLFFELFKIGFVKTWNRGKNLIFCVGKKYCKALSQPFRNTKKNIQSNRARGVNIGHVVLNDFNFLPKGEKTDEFRIVVHKKWSFPLRISSVNVTKSTVSCGYIHIYWRNPSWKASFLCSAGIPAGWFYFKFYEGYIY